MKIKKISMIILVAVTMLVTAIMPAGAAHLNAWGHYEFKYEWTPEGRLRSTHDMWMGLGFDSGPFHARFRLHNTPWWQMQHLNQDSNFHLEHLRLRMDDRLFRGAPPFTLTVGHYIGAHWDSAALHADQPGIMIEGLNLGGFTFNTLFAVRDDFNPDPNPNQDQHNVAAVQVQKRFGDWDLRMLYGGEAKWRTEADASGARFLVNPPKNYDTALVLRFNGHVGESRTNVHGFAASHALKTDAIAKQNATAYEVHAVYPYSRDVRVEAGFRDWDPKYAPVFAPKGDEDPLTLNRGQIGGYGLVNFVTRWPEGYTSDITTRLELYTQRHDNNDPEIAVTKANVDWRVAGYLFALGHRIDNTSGTDALRNRTDLKVEKEFRVNPGRIEGLYEFHLDSNAGQQSVQTHKVRAKFLPVNRAWANVHPYAEVNFRPQGDNDFRLGTHYSTVTGVWAHAEFVFSESHDLRNDSFVKVGYWIGL